MSMITFTTYNNHLPHQSDVHPPCQSRQQQVRQVVELLNIDMASKIDQQAGYCSNYRKSRNLCCLADQEHGEYCKMDKSPQKSAKGFAGKKKFGNNW